MPPRPPLTDEISLRCGDIVFACRARHGRRARVRVRCRAAHRLRQPPSPPPPCGRCGGAQGRVQPCRARGELEDRARRKLLARLRQQTCALAADVVVPRVDERVDDVIGRHLERHLERRRQDA
eukprot:2029625-Prymnesium_polylepis.1